MKQKEVSKNTNLISSKNIEDFANRLLNQNKVKKNKECEKTFKITFKLHP